MIKIESIRAAEFSVALYCFRKFYLKYFFAYPTIYFYIVYIKNDHTQMLPTGLWVLNTNKERKGSYL
jgi:hypothetical protein